MTKVTVNDMKRLYNIEHGLRVKAERERDEALLALKEAADPRIKHAQAALTWRDRAEAAERERDEANNALRSVSLALGGTDEWTDQATMVAYVVNLVIDTERERDEAREALEEIRERSWHEAYKPIRAIVDRALSPSPSPVLGGDEQGARMHFIERANMQTGATPSPSEERYRQALKEARGWLEGMYEMGLNPTKVLVQIDAALSPTQPEGGE